MVEWRALDSKNNMTKLNLDSMNIPERFQPMLKRETKTRLIGQMNAKISLLTFDTHRLNSSGQEYACTTSEVWTIEQAFVARKRDGRHEMCHRHRHMHYAFQIPQLPTENKQPKNRPTYYSEFVKEQPKTSRPIILSPCPLQDRRADKDELQESMEFESSEDSAEEGPPFKVIKSIEKLIN